jgi:hypothetical protein
MGVPQFRQNLAPSGLEVWQLEQFMLNTSQNATVALIEPIIALV